MKTRILFLLLLYSYCVSLYSQESRESRQSMIYHSEYFDCRDFISRNNSENTIFYERDNTISPSAKFGVQLGVTNKECFSVIDRYISKEYPYLSLQEYNKIKKDKVNCQIIPVLFFVNIKGEVVFYHFSIKKNMLKDNPALERHLYNVISALKDKFVSFKPSLVNYDSLEQPTENSVGQIMIPLRMLKDN